MQPVTIQISPYFARRHEEQGRTRGRQRAGAKGIVAHLDALPLRSESAQILTNELQALFALQVITLAKIEQDALHCKLDLTALSAISASELMQAYEQLGLVLLAVSELLGISSVRVSFAKESDEAGRTDFWLWLVAQNALFANRYGAQEVLVNGSYADELTHAIQSVVVSPGREELVRQAVQLVERYGLRFQCEVEGLKTEVNNMVVAKTSEESTRTVIKQSVLERKQPSVWAHVTEGPLVTVRWYVEVDEADKPQHVGCFIEHASSAQRLIVETYTAIANRLLVQVGADTVLAAGSDLLPEYFTEEVAVHPLSDFVSAFAKRFVPTSEFARDDEQVSLLIESASDAACEVCGTDGLSVFGSYGICQVCGAAQMVSSN